MRTDYTQPQRQRRQLERERKAGIIRKLVRIPKEREQELADIVAAWRQEAGQVQA